MNGRAGEGVDGVGAPVETLDVFGNAREEGRPADRVDNGGFSASSVAQIDEGDRLKFARQILAALFFFVILIVVLAVMQPENKALDNIFEWAKFGVLPLVTLVIGFYFPNRK